MKELEDELQRAQKRARLAEEKQADLQKALQKAEEKQADLQNALEKAEEKQSDLQKALQNAEEEKQAEVQNALQNAEKEKQAEEEKHKALEIARKAQADAMQLQLQNAIMKKQLRESVAHLVSFVFSPCGGPILLSINISYHFKVANSKKTSDFRKAQSENYIIRVQNPHGHSVADDLVKQIWDSVRSAKNVDGKTFRFPNEPIASKGGKLRENEDVHPLIMDLSKFIQLNLGMIENAFFNGPGLWFQEQIVYPDIVIAASGLTKPTFVDAKTLFELKLPKKYEDTDVSTAGTQQVL